MKRKKLIWKLEKGGINIVDIESKFLVVKSSWVERLTNKLSQYVVKNEYFCLWCYKSICKILKMSFFYHEVLLSAFNLCRKQKQPQSLKKDEILSEFIWCNSLIKFKANTICFENWVKVGVLLCQRSLWSEWKYVWIIILYEYFDKERQYFLWICNA